MEVVECTLMIGLWLQFFTPSVVLPIAVSVGKGSPGLWMKKRCWAKTPNVVLAGTRNASFHRSFRRPRIREFRRINYHMLPLGHVPVPLTVVQDVGVGVEVANKWSHPALTPLHLHQEYKIEAIAYWTNGRQLARLARSADHFEGRCDECFFSAAIVATMQTRQPEP